MRCYETTGAKMMLSSLNLFFVFVMQESLEVSLDQKGDLPEQSFRKSISIVFHFLNSSLLQSGFTPEKSELRNNLRSVFEANVFGASIVTETFIPALK